ncbi:MAG TPA: ATP-binding protein [Dissulfurispiraceae bacterium]|nr:ATP-binding protein [Dissulfurispiraceae bacterium]
MNDAELIENLKREKALLSHQVSQLIKAEGKIYRYQEQLDAQLKEYKDLYDLSRRIGTLFSIEKVCEEAVRYVIHNLEYERVVIFGLDAGTGDYSVCAFDGYYDGDAASRIDQLVVKKDAEMIRRLSQSAEPLICLIASQDALHEIFRCRLLMDEYLLYPLGPHEQPLALMAIGNSMENAAFHRRIASNQSELLSTGNLAGLLSSAIEAQTMYANMEEALEQERLAEEKYRGIFENALEGILQTAGDGRILSCNPAAAVMFGYDSPKEFIRSVESVEHLYVSSERRRELYELMQRKGDVKNFEIQGYHKDGSIHWALISTHPVKNEGMIVTVESMIQDITERKESEANICKLNEELEQRVKDRTSELEKANTDLKAVMQQLESAYLEVREAQSRILQQEKMASIGQLAAGVAHEINNPIGFIISNLNSLKKYIDKISHFVEFQSSSFKKNAVGEGDSLQATIETVRSQRQTLKIDFILGDLNNIITESLSGADRVKKIVQDLKSFSHVDETEFKPADINNGLDTTINIIWNELKYKATLHKEYGDLPHVVCNLGQLNQVFLNILMNAAHAIEQHGIITIRTWKENEKIIIAISDTGSGIPPAKIGRIFEPFFTTKEVGKGTGLGLSIAYDIIKKHRGEIKVDSTIGEGTTFTISIPITT